MRRAPLVIATTVAGTAALVGFHPSRPASLAAATQRSGTVSGRTYDGAVAANRYGNVQVRVTVRNGTLVDVSALQLPQSDPRSAQISAYAAPLLRQEALSAKSAQIDAVSGASYTSESYMTSLRSALAKAGL